MTDTGVSDTELTALIAGLQPATIELRCPITELLTAQCAHCRGIEPDLPELGPWFAATYKGSCSSCGARFEEFDEIRADGEGGWLAHCCGERTDDPAAGIVAAVPARSAGPPPSTVRELRQVLIDFEANRPRSMQTALGPSELGTPCQQEIGRKLVGAPRRPITEPTWAPFQGTAVHASMEQVVEFWNQQLGRERWLAEDRLTVVEAVPAADDGPTYPAVEGNGDAFDTDHDEVVDWKHVGTTALNKLRNGKRLGKHPAEQVSPTYRVQGHLYGLGHSNRGRKVRWVRLVLLARSWKYDDSDEWTEEYREDIALKAIDRYWSIVDLVHSLGGAQAGDLITAVPAAPGKDVCKWCPFYRPGVASDWNGCAGDRPPAAHVAAATVGLIERPA